MAFVSLCFAHYFVTIILTVLNYFGICCCVVAMRTGDSKTPKRSSGLESAVDAHIRWLMQRAVAGDSPIKEELLLVATDLIDKCERTWFPEGKSAEAEKPDKSN